MLLTACVVEVNDGYYYTNSQNTTPAMTILDSNTQSYTS